MAIPVGFLTRYAIPLIVASIYLGDVNIPQQMEIFDKTEKLADQALSEARKEGEGSESFDYIIVGGGSAGAVLANRLSASGQDRVLLLEAGGDPNPVYEALFAEKFFWSTNINKWGYQTVKQDRGCERSDGICSIFTGKALGGGSSINALVYNRCKPKDYDNWAAFTGDSNWRWESVRETYNSFEDYHGYYEDTHNGNHGDGGEMYVGKIDYIPGIEVLEEALNEKGIPTGDLNGGEFTYGFTRMDYNVKDGLRWGTYQAFLQEALNRTNLFIYRHAYATKIEMEEGATGYRANGVTYQRHGKTRTALANKEVIISAGTLQSPKLLLLSGIGPREHLTEVGIETVLDLPVGQYFQDHLGINVINDGRGFRVNTSFGVDRNTTENVLIFIQNGTGPLSAPMFGTGSQFMTGYLNSSQNNDLSWPELQYFIFHQNFPEENNRQEFYFSVQLSRYETGGSIKLASNNSDDYPLIDYQLFEDMNDLEKIVDGAEMMMDIFMNSDAYRKIGIEDMIPYPACNMHEYRSRDYWRCVVLQTTTSFLHPTSSCRMGPNNTVAVLDSKLKVFGTENLRVIDASSMPFVPSGNTNMPAMLMGARGAEIILSEQ